jgi:hypothetical protein
MSKQTFIITSAIHTNYGIYSSKQRAEQTLETVNSARKQFPDCVTILVDNSKIDIQDDTSDEVEALIEAVDYYIDNSEDKDIQFFHNNVKNYDIGKNSMEVLGFLKALDSIMKNMDLDLSNDIFASERIFKYSGRYQLVDDFDITQFQVGNKWVFKTAMQGWCDSSVAEDKLLQTRLWSFTPDLIEPTIELYKTCWQYMEQCYLNQKYIDIEHAMYKFINKEKLVEVDRIGVQGNIAPNGMAVVD